MTKLHKLGFLGVATSLALVGFVQYQRPVAVGWSPKHEAYVLPNGWKVGPVGSLVALPGDMPGSIVYVDGGKRAIINTCGFHDHSLNLIDIEGRKIESTIKYPENWIGMAMTTGGELLVSAGKPKSGEMLRRFSYKGGVLAEEKPWKTDAIPKDQRFVSSILSGKSGTYVLNVQSDEVLKLDGGRNVAASSTVGYRPYAIAESPSGSTLAITNWGEQTVSLLDAKTLKERKRIKVGAHPTAVIYHPDGRLFVACSGTNYVSVISGSEEIGRITVGLGIKQKVGTVPISLALSPEGTTLYVACAGNNTVAVADVSSAVGNNVKGYIPTDRYPALVSVTPNGQKLIIGTSKGRYGANAGQNVTLEGANIRGKDGKAPYKYIGGQLEGQLAIVDVPTATELETFTKQCFANLRDIQGELDSRGENTEEAEKAFRKIKHCIYIIRENRTYDQVLGDIPKGNGDPSLTMFGEKITPNGHKIANEFALFDNLYADGETSQSGHQWTDAAYATDYCEKQWVLSYSRREQVKSDTRLTSSPTDYIWTRARKAGLTARVYGEYVDVQEDHDSLSNAQVKSDPEKYGYSEPFERIFANGGRDTEKVAEFLRELAIAEETGKWPNLMVMALPEDHTHGFSAGQHSPRAMVANNDLALGQLVEAVSKSKFWAETAIFVIQDDAQDGPDHVDSHRTVGYVVSPYSRKGIVDSTHYTTASMLRTMGLILGLEPLTQYDALAMPFIKPFGASADLRPYRCEPPRVDVEERNPKTGALAQWSKRLDFTDIDKADFDSLNRLLWAGYMNGRPYPRKTK